jgi:hypothetical protein
MRMGPLESDHFEPVRATNGPQRPRSVHKACGHCHRPVTLRYRPASTFRSVEHLWACPYDDCQRGATNRITLPGALLECWPGHGQTPPDDTPAV